MFSNEQKEMERARGARVVIIITRQTHCHIDEGMKIHTPKNELCTGLNDGGEKKFVNK